MISRRFASCKGIGALLVALVAACLATSALAQAGAVPLPTTRLTAGIHVITAELATNDATRGRGLMFREQLAPNHGMLFIFPRPSAQCMWMRNTPLPLSVAFISDGGAIVNIEDMQPHTEASHCSKQPVRYALEMAQGWFARRGLKPGSKVTGLPAAAGR